jgi:hypothetical protein
MAFTGLYMGSSTLFFFEKRAVLGAFFLDFSICIGLIEISGCKGVEPFNPSNTLRTLIEGFEGRSLPCLDILMTFKATPACSAKSRWSMFLRRLRRLTCSPIICSHSSVVRNVSIIAPYWDVIIDKYTLYPF